MCAIAVRFVGRSPTPAQSGAAFLNFFLPTAVFDMAVGGNDDRPIRLDLDLGNLTGRAGNAFALVAFRICIHKIAQCAARTFLYLQQMRLWMQVSGFHTTVTSSLVYLNVDLGIRVKYKIYGQTTTRSAEN